MTEKTKSKPEFNNVSKIDNEIVLGKQFKPEELAAAKEFIEQKHREREMDSLPRKNRKKSATFNNR